MFNSSLRWYAAWLLTGLTLAFGVLSLMTVGIFILPVGLVAAVLLARQPAAQRGLPGVVSGAGLPFLYVAFLNRQGPGTICTTTATSQTCADQYDPRGWLAIGLILICAGVVAFSLRERSRRQRSTT